MTIQFLKPFGIRLDKIDGSARNSEYVLVSSKSKYRMSFRLFLIQDVLPVPRGSNKNALCL